MGEIIKRFLIIGGIGVLFVLTSALIGEANRYGAKGPNDVGILQYLGLKKAPSPTPEARPVTSLEEEKDKLYSPKPSASPEANQEVGSTQVENPDSTEDASPTPSTNSTTGQYYYDSSSNQYIQYQAPRDSF